MSITIVQSSTTGTFSSPTTLGNWIIAAANSGTGGIFGPPIPFPVPNVGSFSDDGGNQYAATLRANAVYAVGPYTSVSVGVSYAFVATASSVVSVTSGTTKWVYELAGVGNFDSSASGATSSVPAGFTASNSVSYSSGLAGANDFYDANIGAAGSYSLGDASITTTHAGDFVYMLDGAVTPGSGGYRPWVALAFSAIFPGDFFQYGLGLG